MDIVLHHGQRPERADEMLLFKLIKVQPLNHRITNAGPLWLNLAACCKCCAAPNRRLAQLHELLVVRVLQLCQCPGSVGNLLLCVHAWMN